MTRTLSMIALAALALTGAAPASALGRADQTCPAAFDPLAATPKGWKRFDPPGSTPAAGALAGIDVYTTYPEDGVAPLAPENAPANATRDTWYIARPPRSGGPMLYLACRYAGTSSLIYRALPPGINECVAARKIEPGQGLKVSCNSRR